MRHIAEKYLLLSIYDCDTEQPTTDEEVLRHISAATGKPLVQEKRSVTSIKV